MIRILSIIALAIVLALVGLQAFMRTPPVDAQFTCSGTTTDGQECACADSRALACENWAQRTTACWQGENCSTAIFKSFSQFDFSTIPPFGSQAIYSSPAVDTNSNGASVPNCPGITGTNCPGGGFVDMYIAQNQQDVYFRYYIQNASPHITIGAEKIWEVHDRGFSNDQVFYGHFSDDDPAIHIHCEGCVGSGNPVITNGALHQNIGTPVPINNDTWYCIEVHEVVNNPIGAPNGTLEMWIDDVLKLQYTGIHARTQGVPAVGFFRYTMSGRNNYTGHATAPAFTRYLDRIVVANARIGCSPATATAPNPPTNVTVTTP